jgi:hypothetical protein
MSRTEVLAWVSSLPRDCSVGIHRGAMWLESSDGDWLEIGAMPEPECEDDTPDCAASLGLEPRL